MHIPQERVSGRQTEQGPGARPAASFAQARRQPGRARLWDPGSVGFSAASASPVSGDGAWYCSQGSGFRPGPAVDTGHAGGCRVESVASRAKLRLRAGSRREGGMPWGRCASCGSAAHAASLPGASPLCGGSASLSPPFKGCSGICKGHTQGAQRGPQGRRSTPWCVSGFPCCLWLSCPFPLPPAPSLLC